MNRGASWDTIRSSSGVRRERRIETLGGNGGGAGGGGGEREKGSFLLSCKVTVKFCSFTFWFGLFQGVVMIKMEI